jgi:hypothetical protein
MSENQRTLSFSSLSDLNYLNISVVTEAPSLYMICQKDSAGNNQVIFAGVASNLKEELLKQLDRWNSKNNISFCYSPTTAKSGLTNSKKPLYQRVA